VKGAAEPYRMLVEQMSEGALTISAEGVILYCNAAFARMLGLPRERLVGALFATLLAGSNHAFQFDRFLARTAEGGQDLRLRTDGGFDLHVQVSSSRLSIDGEAIYCLAITDLSRQELRVLHEAIVSSSADAIFPIEPDGTIESWNAATEQLFGYSAEQAIGANVRTLLLQERQQHADAELRRVGNGEIARFDESCITSTGAVEMSLILSPIMTPAGSCGAIAVIARDISDRKQAER
jgi:PAS domain S-box-containing protein